MVKRICVLLLKISGWKIDVQLPEDLRSFILVGAPHTSNHDFVPAMAMAYALKRNAHFAIKSDWLKFPLNLVMKPLGAIGINREKLKKGAQSNTDAMAALFKAIPDLVLMVTPEGTRSRTSKWKTGFYYTAQKAGVPIVLAYVDYKKKILATGQILYPRNFEEDMKSIMNFYRGFQGKIPENFELDERFR